MKKITLILLVFLIVACSVSSNSDENTKNNTASIVGTWKVIKKVTVCQAGNEEVEMATTCELKERRVFTEDGKFSISDWNEQDGECKLWPTGEFGTYRITNGKAFGVSEDILWLNYLSYELEELGHVLYKVSPNLLFVGSDTNHDGQFCDDTSKVSYVYFEYARVE